MKIYFASLAVGLLVGGIYGALNVRSPAPPVIALLGLFGILVGEQIVPAARRLAIEGSSSLSALASDCSAHVFGTRPGRWTRDAHPVDDRPAGKG